MTLSALAQLVLESEATNSGNDSNSPAVTANVLALAGYQKYLNGLCTYSVADLLNLPQQLDENSQQLTKQLSDLAYSEYKCLLGAHATATAMHSSLGKMDDMLKSVDRQLPELKSAWETFRTAMQTPPSSVYRSAISGVNSQALLEQHAQMELLIRQSNNLVQILDIPDLMNALVNEAKYEEAMDLQQFVARLKSRYPRVTLLQRIAADCQASAQKMLDKLLNMLQQNMNLSESIKIIGHLRRLQIFSEEELRSVFLIARHQYFETTVRSGEAALMARSTAALKSSTASPSSPGGGLDDSRRLSRAGLLPSAVDGEKAVTRLKFYLDTARTCFIDVMTQYQAIFADTIATSSSKSMRDSSSMVTASAVLHSFMLYVSRRILDTIQAHLKCIGDTSAISHLYTQAMHFGVALGRKGLDIRPLLAPPFVNRVFEIVAGQLQTGTRMFIDELHVNRVTNMIARDKAKADLEEWASTISNLASSGVWSAPSANKANFNPPSVLLEFPALAALTNSYLTGLNSLRLLPSSSLFTPLAQCFNQCLNESISAIVAVYAQASSDSTSAVSLSDKTTTVPPTPTIQHPLLQQEVVERQRRHKEFDLIISRVLRDIWIPFCLGCFYDGIYSEMRKMADIAGLTSDSAGKLNGESVEKDAGIVGFEKSLAMLRLKVKLT